MVDRGPDAQGAITYQAEGLHSYFTAHTRLSIIDPTERSNQPIENERYILTYNGEIYNYKHLAPHAPSDTHALLEIITREDVIYALEHINGMFAFALYDKITHTLTLSRDPFGIKPLYIYETQEYIAYASTPAALTELKEQWHLNLPALQSYLALGSVFHRSLFVGIEPLPAAHYRVINTHVSATLRYYTPTYTPGTPEQLLDECIAEIDECKVASDVPVYLFLSGGIDSTFIATRCRGLDAIHLASPEQNYAQHAADVCGLKLQTVDTASANIIAAHQSYVQSCGEPSMAAHIPYLTAARVGMFATTAISANGADELFFGYERTPQNKMINPQQQDHILRSPGTVALQLKQLTDQFILKDPRLDSARWFELITYVMHDLNKTLDFATMAHSLEMRVPFLSRNLVNRALSIEPSAFFHDALGGKAPLKKYLMQKGFSRQFVTREKLGFSLHQSPEGHAQAKHHAWAWLHRQPFAAGFLNQNMNGRYEDYLKNSALSLMIWQREWHKKLIPHAALTPLE